MDTFLQQMANGLSLASIYALIGIGITVVFGMTGIVNFAQGELLMLGGYATFVAVGATGNYFLGAAIAAFALGLLGLGLERSLFRFTLQSPINGFIVSLGLIIVLQHVAVKIWSTAQTPGPKPFTTIWELGGVLISATRGFVIVGTLLVLVAFFFLISRSRWGKALRATAADRETAAIMGIPVSRYISSVFVLGSALAGFGGALLISLYPITPFIGTQVVVKGFAVALIGGLGNVSGAALAALILGLVEAISAGYLSPQWTDAYAFAMMILILLVRPSGLLRGQEGSHAA